ncbi:hypothetical protein ACONUD_01050 [Microbulbifer harenosus]|uniref:hypothetical protein n=1 Tax=Microbulbifer harenosus TaxID=2576840 RepID=UPI003BA17FA2
MTKFLPEGSVSPASATVKLRASAQGAAVHWLPPHQAQQLRMEKSSTISLAPSAGSINWSNPQTPIALSPLGSSEGVVTSAPSVQGKRLVDE